MRAKYIGCVRKALGTGGTCAVRKVAFDWGLAVIVPPPLPVAPEQTRDSGPSEAISVECDRVEAAPPMDALYTGRLTGTVPAGWTRDGWTHATRDRMSRTNCPDMQRRLREELATIKPQYLLSTTKTPNNRHARQRKTPADRPLW